MSFGKAGFLYTLLIIAFILSGGAKARTPMVSPADLADGHSVMEIAALGDNIWVGYEQGIFFSDNGGLSWNHYDTANGYGRGVVTVAVVNDSALWTATYYDTVIYGYDYYVNGGIYRTDPQVMDWEFIDIPGRQDAGNIIYDIDPGEEVVWTANWWAGLKKSTDGGLNWEMIVPDTTVFNPMDKFHHRIFSVAVSGEIICAGSQGGLNLSIDGGVNWENLKHINGQASLTADKIATTDFRDTGANREIWAACWSSVSSGGTSGVSISSDTGHTWRTVLTGRKGWSFLFHQADIFVACNSGLWFSADDGEDFINLTASHLSDEIEIYEVEMTADSTLWIGTSDGLYRGGYGGEWWERVDFISLDAAADAGSRPTTFELGQNYPNPFNPATTIPVELERSSRVDLQIYDILGQRQKTVLSAILPAGSHDLIWDGSDDQGRDLPSGIYFYHLKTDQSRSTRKMILLR